MTESGYPRNCRGSPAPKVPGFCTTEFSSGYVIAPVLFLAFVTLYGAPGSTGLYFAWEISPELTPLLMGAGYGAGVYFFCRVVTVGEWHRVHLLFPGIAVFTLAMLIATVLHWEAFNHGCFST